MGTLEYSSQVVVKSHPQNASCQDPSPDRVREGLWRWAQKSYFNQYP